ncbi:hypothetical protein OEZ86_003007 [Tetradesmus obliquus]|nr:hypothetical protein OEZ86_003007 [Tetradesmus obliquus]
MDTADDLCFSGKVPDKAYRAYSTAHDNFEAVRQHIINLQQCLLPSSTDIVASAVAYLQLVAQDDDMFVSIAQSGQLTIFVGAAAGVLAAAEAEESADDARLRAEQQLSRTEDIAAYCDATQKQLQQAIDVVTATSCVVHLAGFFSGLAAATSRAGRTAERVEARCADTQSRTYTALRAVLLRQLGTVTASGASFTAVMRRLQGGDQQATADSHMRPAYKKVACAAQQLRGALRAFQQ